MQVYRRRAAGWSALPSRVVLAALVALALLAFGAIAVPGRAHAGSGGPKITFVAPIYAGQNNGYAEGPVGANVSVQGSGWTGGGGNVTISLADEQNDTSGQPGSACTNGSPTVPISGLSQPVDGSGNFTFTPTFQWPTAAGTKGHSYWACGTQGGTKSQGVDKFTVLSASAPLLYVSNADQAYPGGKIAVTGKNWLPGNQQITVVITPCLQCDPGFTTSAQNLSTPDGSLGIWVPVPTQAQVGSKLFVIAANGSSDPSLPPALNVNDPSNAPSFTVIAQATPTPTPTATSTPTATVSATASSAANAGGGGGNTNSSSGNTVLIVLLAALGVVLLLGAVVAIMLFLRPRGPAPVKGGSPYGGYPPQGGQYGGPRRTGGSYSPPSYSDTNADYYDGPPPRSAPPGQGWGNAGGWQGNPQGPGPEDGSGDDPTIGMRTPWRR